MIDFYNTPIITTHNLLKIYKNNNVIIIDASNGPNAKSNYLINHLDGALFIELNTDLANIKDDFKNGGRHPLPDTNQFSETLSNFGITPKSHVIIYDDKNGANAAARFWWMLKAIGHKKVQVLDGGFQEALKLNFPTNSAIPIIKKVPKYLITNWLLPIINLNNVEIASKNNTDLIIDVREHSRYIGKQEPIDLVAGHIPNAINIPFSENLDSDGLFLSKTALFKKYNEFVKKFQSNNIIVHCGSGVTACHTLLAFEYAGLQIPKLYIGSWSEWSRNNKPIATEPF